MRKKIILLTVFLFSFQFIQSQNTQKKISISFNNTSIEQSIELIEQKTAYRFFYTKSMLNSKEKITKSFSNSTIATILKALFKNTNLNYYILENTKIILTKNSIIYKSVYQPVADSTKNNTKENNAVPIIVSNETVKLGSRVKTVKIGKDTYSNRRKTFTLKGTVKNRATNTPIENLVLLVRKKNIHTTTDSKGNFSFDLPYGVNMIETLLSGIEKTKTRFIIYGDGTYNFKLNEDIEQLDEVVINANKVENIKNVITGLAQIKIEDVKTVPQVLGERDIFKIATTLPGIKSAGEGAEGVNVRGGKSDQNLFLLDKSVIYNPTHFLGLFSAINPFTTEDLKIYKGSVPAEFGGRISSVFDITTKSSNTKKLKGEASIGPVSSNISLDIPIVKEKSGLLVGVRSTYSDWMLKAINNKELNNSSVSFYDALAKYTHKINDNNSIKAFVYFSKDAYSIASDTTNSYKNRILSIDWSHKFNDKNHGNLLLSNSNYSFDIDYNGHANSNFKLNYTINEYDLKLKMIYLHSKKHKIDYGIESKLYKINPGTIQPKGNQSIINPFSTQEEKALESALFVADNFKVNDKFTVDFGARYTLFSSLGKTTQRLYAENLPKNETTVVGVKKYGNNEVVKTYNGLSLRVSSRYLINENLSIKASLNNSYQFIHRLTNNTSASPTDTWRLSNSNIKPQEALQASLGVYKNSSDNVYELSLEGYYKKYKNILDYKVGATFLLNKYIETEILQGPGKSYGVELLIRKNTGKLNGWLSYSYSRSFLTLNSQFIEERINNGKPFPTNFDKPHDLNLILNYKITKRYSFSTNFTYQTGRPITYPTGKYTYHGSEYLLYSDRNKFRVPDYFRLDLGLNIEGNHKIKKLAHSFWNISVYNVLGRNNPYSIFFVTENGKVKSYQSSIFSRPIPTITYNLKF